MIYRGQSDQYNSCYSAVCKNYNLNVDRKEKLRLKRPKCYI